MGSSMVNMKHGGRTQHLVNDMLHQNLGGRTPQANGHDHIVQSGNNCYSSLRVVTTDEAIKNIFLL